METLQLLDNLKETLAEERRSWWTTLLEEADISRNSREKYGHFLKG